MADLLAPFVPTAADPFDLKKAGHLLRRAGFGASLASRRACVEGGLDAAFAQLTHGGDDAGGLDETVIALGDFDRLRSYRVWRMLAGRDRLRERMAFFWHRHFATSNQKLRDPQALARHFAVFDAHGLGRFDDLVLALCKDPALLRWLDNDTNVAGKPNENFARELFELFTLGRGNYTEHDVREAARAFTGWHVKDGAFKLVARHHDGGEKELFGQRGKLGGEDVVAITLARRESARFVARALLEFFVHPEPTDAEIDALAACYAVNDRHIGKTLDVLLRSVLFFGARAWRSRVKDPVDLVVGTVRALGATASPERLARAAATMGQSVGEPPNVAGWPGERAWLNAATWLLRSNFAAELGAGFTLRPGLEECVASDDEVVDALVDGALSDASRSALAAFAASPAAKGHGARAAFVQAVQDLPEAQLL